MKLLVERMAGVYSSSFHDGVTHLVTLKVCPAQFSLVPTVLIVAGTQSEVHRGCPEGGPGDAAGLGGGGLGRLRLGDGEGGGREVRPPEVSGNAGGECECEPAEQERQEPAPQVLGDSRGVLQWGPRHGENLRAGETLL